MSGSCRVEGAGTAGGWVGRAKGEGPPSADVTSLDAKLAQG